MTPQEQLRVLMAMALCGAALGAAYDGLWLVRTLLRGRLVMAAADLLYGVLCAAGVTGAALLLRVDALRWYTLTGALLGMGLYRASAGALLRRAAAWVAGLKKKLGKKAPGKGKK